MHSNLGYDSHNMVGGEVTNYCSNSCQRLGVLSSKGELGVLSNKGELGGAL